MKLCRLCKSQGPFNAKQNKCKLCQKEYNRNYYLQNITCINGKVKEWQQANPEKVREYARKGQARWRADNPEKVERQQKRRVVSGRAAKAVKKWRINNSEKVDQFRQVRRHREASVDFEYSKIDKQFTKQLFEESCVKCGSRSNICIDHFLPLSLGFGLTRKNAILLCRSCNSSKGAKLPEDFFKKGKYNMIKAMLKLA